jgi:hypothetical protein
LWDCWVDSGEKGQAVRGVSVEYEPQPVIVGNRLTQSELEVDMYWRRFVPNLSDLQVPRDSNLPELIEMPGMGRMEK